jgi:hypothetical protein
MSIRAQALCQGAQRSLGVARHVINPMLLWSSWRATGNTVSPLKSVEWPDLMIISWAADGPATWTMAL